MEFVVIMKEWNYEEWIRNDDIAVHICITPLTQCALLYTLHLSICSVHICVASTPPQAVCPTIYPPLISDVHICVSSLPCVLICIE